MDELTIVARFVHFAAICLLGGLPLFRWAVCTPAWQAVSDKQARQAYMWTAAAALLSALVWFAVVAAEMAGSWTELLSPQTLIEVAFDTQFGALWRWRVVLAVVLASLPICAPNLSPARLDKLVLVLALPLAATLVGVGHGRVGEGTLGLLHGFADVLHLICAAAWLGGLAGLFWLLRPKNVDREGGALDDVVRRFSRLGYVAVGLLVITGLVNSLVLVGGPAALIGTDYGRVLSIKLGLFGAMLAIAAFNRFVVSPGLQSGDPKAVAILRRSVAIELGVGAGVLAVVAALGTIHPPS